MMKFKKSLWSVLALSFISILFLQCENVAPDQNTNEADILAVLMADDSTFTLDGFDNEDLQLLKNTLSSDSNPVEVNAFVDSNYVWAFGRSDMNVERTNDITELDDSTATAVVSHHVTGIFHARQFERIIVNDSTWTRGDSIRFSEKALDMTFNRNVLLHKRTNPDGDDVWVIMGVTATYGASPNTTLGIEAISIQFGDSTLVLDDFANYYFNRENAIRFHFNRFGRIEAMISNDVSDEAESVNGIWGGHPRLPNLRHVGFRYMETNGDGYKVYAQLIRPEFHPNRHKRGQVQVIDFRTLFDHDYLAFNSVAVGMMYHIIRPPQP